MAITLTRHLGGSVTTGILLALDVSHTMDVPTRDHATLSGATVITVGTAPAARTGTWRLLCESRAVALAVEALHKTPGRALTLTITDPTVPTIVSTYLPKRVRIYAAPRTGSTSRWVVDVAYRETT